MLMTEIEQNALRIEVERLQKKLELMKQLSTIEGFFDFYFKAIPDHSSNEEAFNYVNDIYLELYGKARYSDHRTFKQIIRYYLKPKK